MVFMDVNKIREQYDVEIKNLELQRDYLLNKIKTFNKCKEDSKEGNVNIEELNSLLCWQNLCYCCRPSFNGSGKKCMWRDFVLSVLDINKDDFIRIKEEAASVFYSKVNSKIEKKE